MNKFLVLGIIISLTTISYGNDLDDALMDAVYEGNLAKVKEFVENGANVNLTNKKGYTALMYASENGHTDIVEFLKSVGAKE